MSAPPGPTAFPRDTARALRVGPGLLARGSPRGPLRAVTFVAKDLFDVAGHPTGAGNPDWLAAARPAATHAAAVSRLLEAGATLVGKAHTDELAFSLSGSNVHYGTPGNPAAPGRLPGGSSSGSAAAVASGLADLGLGTDTGGSIRIPASYCGLFGLRPSHGRVPLTGAVALAPSFDTAGLLARSAARLRAGMLALLDPVAQLPRPRAIERLLVADDAAAQLDRNCQLAWRTAVAALGLPQVHVQLADAADGLDGWRAAYQTLQSAEAWAVHGAWFEQGHPRVAADVEQRFRAGGAITEQELSAARLTRAAVRTRLDSLLEPGFALVVPSACGVAPPLALGGDAMADVRRRVLNLTSAAGLAGAPAISLPLASVDGLPLGVSLLGRPGDDEALLDLAVRHAGSSLS